MVNIFGRHYTHVVSRRSVGWWLVYDELSDERSGFLGVMVKVRGAGGSGREAEFRPFFLFRALVSVKYYGFRIGLNNS